MKRFYFWMKLHSLIMTIGDVSQWINHKVLVVISWAGRYSLDEARKHIPTEFQDQLIERIDR